MLLSIPDFNFLGTVFGGRELGLFIHCKRTRVFDWERAAGLDWEECCARRAVSAIYLLWKGRVLEYIIYPPNSFFNILK